MEESKKMNKNTTEKTLESRISDDACSIRGDKSARKYKDFILSLITTKRLFDVFDDELNPLSTVA